MNTKWMNWSRITQGNNLEEHLSVLALGSLSSWVIQNEVLLTENVVPVTWAFDGWNSFLFPSHLRCFWFLGLTHLCFALEIESMSIIPDENQGWYSKYLSIGIGSAPASQHWCWLLTTWKLYWCLPASLGHVQVKSYDLKFFWMPRGP